MNDINKRIETDTMNECEWRLTVEVQETCGGKRTPCCNLYDKDTNVVEEFRHPRCVVMTKGLRGYEEHTESRRKRVSECFHHRRKEARSRFLPLWPRRGSLPGYSPALAWSVRSYGPRSWDRRNVGYMSYVSSSSRRFPPPRNGERDSRVPTGTERKRVDKRTARLRAWILFP